MSIFTLLVLMESLWSWWRSHCQHLRQSWWNWGYIGQWDQGSRSSALFVKFAVSVSLGRRITEVSRDPKFRGPGRQTIINLLSFKSCGGRVLSGTAAPSLVHQRTKGFRGGGSSNPIQLNKRLLCAYCAGEKYCPKDLKLQRQKKSLPSRSLHPTGENRYTKKQILRIYEVRPFNFKREKALTAGLESNPHLLQRPDGNDLLKVHPTSK